MKNGPNNKTIDEKNKLYEKYKNLVYKVIVDTHCDIKTEEDFEEYYSVAQYGLAKAINNISGDYQNAKSTYFYTYMRNELISYFHYKTTPRRKLLGTNMADIDDCRIDSGINLERDLLIKESQEEMLEVLNNLKPEYKELITRRYGIGRDNETIGSIALDKNVSHQAIQQKEKYILNKMRKELINKWTGKTDY